MVVGAALAEVGVTKVGHGLGPAKVGPLRMDGRQVVAGIYAEILVQRGPKAA